MLPPVGSSRMRRHRIQRRRAQARHKMNKRTLGLLIGAYLMVPVLAGSVLVGSALAQDHRDRGHDRDDHDRRGPPPHYYVHDMDRWHGGHWYHGRHGNRDGWWWIIGGAWYFYPAPVYPYPDPYSLQVVVAPPLGAPPTVTPAPPAQAPYCREYHGDAIINGSNQPFYGTACLEADGAWHIVN